MNRTDALSTTCMRLRTAHHQVQLALICNQHLAIRKRGECTTRACSRLLAPAVLSHLVERYCNGWIGEECHASRWVDCELLQSLGKILAEQLVSHGGKAALSLRQECISLFARKL